MQLKNLKSGDKFFLNGQIFVKQNSFGDAFGICVCKDESGNDIQFNPTMSVQKMPDNL